MRSSAKAGAAAGGASRSPISTHSGQWSRCRAVLPAWPSPAALSALLFASDRAIQRVPSEVQTCTHCALPALASARETVGASADNATTQAVSQTSQRGKPRGRPVRRFMSAVVKPVRALDREQRREMRKNPFEFILWTQNKPPPDKDWPFERHQEIDVVAECKTWN